MTPSKTELENRRLKIADCYAQSGVDPLVASPDDIPHAFVILGSSRSGSSLLFDLLAQTGAFWTPQGEETPFYRLCGLGWVNVKENSDALKAPVSEQTREMAFQYLVNDLGRNVSSTARVDRFVAQCATRLLLQWPSLELDPAALVASLCEICARTTDADAVWSSLTARWGLESGFYDLPGPKSRNLQLEAPSFVMEEPPFVVQHCRETPTRETLSQAPLLLKTSTNAYRVAWLRTLFPKTKFHWIFLSRNPAASINGLMDGWLSNAFHSHNLQFVQPLKIRGYSDVIPYGDRWWKFDLPPGWTDYDNAPLAEVCAFQWRSAYEFILKSVGEAPTLRIRFEDLLDPARAPATLKQVFDFAGVHSLESLPQPHKMRPIMASKEPQLSRWRRREDQIWPLLESARLREIAEQLGYDLSSPDRLL